MLNLRRRKATGSAGQGTADARVPISTLPSSVAFVTTVMSGSYRQQIPLQDLARVEREFIGEGHSFQVELTYLVDSTSEKRDRAVVVKSTANLTDVVTSRWDDMRLEVLTLLHPPIAAHRNIVDLLAVGWESGLSEQVRPILVVPYASCGTLDVFSMDPDATIAWKHNIMLDVARGLEVLHGCGIVHGDLKSENVLLFWEGERPVAKLSDFGCSIVNQRQQDRLLGGSPPWNCPEWRDTLPAEALPLTDVYCLGLLIWRTALAEADPFRRLASLADGEISPSNATIDIFKNLPDNRFATEAKESLSAAVGISEFQVTLLSAALDNCLHREPRERNLDDCLDCLKGLVSEEVDIETGESDSGVYILNPEPSIDPAALQELPWPIQQELYRYHSERISSTSHRGDGAAYIESQMWLFVCCLQGIGTDANDARACNHILEAAKHGHPIAKSLAHRAVTAFSPPFESTIPTQWLLRSIEMGCLGAIEDFVHFVSQSGQANAAQLLSIAIHRLHNFTAGVGVGNFLDPNGSRLNTLSIESEYEFEKRLSTESRTPGFDVNEFAVNSRGDRLLHLAATCNFSEATRFIIRLFGQRLDINAVNDDGETAMLSASRAGQSETIRILLENGADLRPSKKGESPLHWLGAFFSDYADIAQLMLHSVGQGQRKVRLHQKASRVAYSPYWGSEFPAGTPLHRAVHFGLPGVVETLLDLGADPNEPNGIDPQLSALQLACSRHQARILDIILTKMNVNNVNNFTSPPLLHTALSKYSRLQGLVDNGVHARDAQGLKDTVAILMSRKADPGLLAEDHSKPGFGVTALYKAVQSTSIHAVEIALSEPLLRPTSILETPSGEDSLTPLELAVKNGTLDIVKALLSAGAQPKRPLADGRAARCMSVLHACALMRDSTPPAHQTEIFHLLGPYFSDGLDVGYGGHKVTGGAGPVFESPFCLAVRVQQFNLVSALLERGADIDFGFDTLIDGSSGWDHDMESLSGGQHFESRITILGTLLTFRTPALISSIRFLLGYDGSGKKKNDWAHATPSPVVCTASNWTVWHAVAMRNNKTLAYAVDLTRETLSYLKETYGQDLVNSRSRQLGPDDVGGKTALHVAAECTNTEVVAALLRMGADSDAQDSRGAKALDYALAVMMEDIELDAGLDWTGKAAMRERERRTQVYTLLGGSMDIFE